MFTGREVQASLQGTATPLQYKASAILLALMFGMKEPKGTQHLQSI